MYQCDELDCCNINVPNQELPAYKPLSSQQTLAFRTSLCFGIMAEKQELNCKERFCSPNEDEDTPATNLYIKLFCERY